MRSFTHTETAFLAWVYGQIATMNAEERFDASAEGLRRDWEELTGDTLDADFHEFALKVHECQ
ncbi:hypothetical protein [Phaeobacter inhibens]|uniref:hypothetical protein n=1 Tax=Phaeobacter inhibens TaxID=221822 RepID=UPI000CA26B59|nr:hypothetical protein [Phaeobacter inhibens]AUQ71058.1 hypothetical protein PhaeoP54_02179 [Phaeobacter inhibens]